MNYLVTFERTCSVVKADNRKQVEDFMRNEYALNPQDYSIAEANDDVVKFAENNGGKIYCAKSNSN